MSRWQPTPFLVYLVLAVISAGLYLAASRAGGEIGYPLDDAWIHQTYARNLGQTGELAFTPGVPSAGSTAPLWTLVLAPGYWLPIEPHLWTYVVGTLLLATTAWQAHRLVLNYHPKARRAAWLTGALVLAEWHLVWAAVSGMEVLLLAALAMGVFVIAPKHRAPWLGLAAGLAIWVRPDGLLLLPCLVARWFEPGERRGRRFWTNVITAGVIVAAYLALNLWLAGTLWPNTLFAKQAEYAAMAQGPLLVRLAQLAAQPFIGVAVLLLPGIALLLRDQLATPEDEADTSSVTGRLWRVAVPLAWVAAMIGAYALRLPVTYQHGRYLMPVIPVLVALGGAGAAGWVRTRSRRMGRRVISRAWVWAIGLVLAAFWVLGAQAYAVDVQIIQTEMVRTAKWIAGNTELDAVIAAHDIGALGYYGGRPVLDLAGLVSPEVIPFMRDEGKLAEWLDAEGADYVMTFPGWYTTLLLSPQAEQVYTSAGTASQQAGGENMAVYQWHPAGSP